MIIHITGPDGLRTLRETGTLAPESLRHEGFVHCCTGEQLDAVVERWFGGVDQLVLLTIDETKLEEELRWDEVYPGERYPHLYGPIREHAVVGAEVRLNHVGDGKDSC